MPHQPMPREQALSLVRKLLDAAFHRDYERVASFYTADAVAVSPVFGEVRGRDAVGATWRTLFTTFSDLAIENVDYLVDGDRVAVLGKICTTDRIGWFGQPPTGSPITYRLVLLFTVIDGLVVHDERIYDSAGVVERLEKSRLDKELRTASDVQQALLPRTAHVGRFYESVGDSIPCRAIGGDFFELMELPSGDLGILLGDVAGKGPAAALLAALLQGMFAVEAPGAGSPALTLSRINRRLAARGIGPRFATLVYGVLSADGRFTYSNAGHNPPVLAARSGVRRLEAGGPLLGVFAGAVFDEETLQLHPHDTLVMFTDGVTEARNPENEEFGDDRLIACVAANAASPLADLMKSIFDAVDGFCQGTDQGDDITVTVSRFSGLSQSPT